MEINLSLLETYFDKNGHPATINVNIESNEPMLTFISGKNKEGSRREFLNTSELYNILIINKIIGENSLVKNELEALRNELNAGLGNKNNREQKIENLIYGTLAKYIIQMLISSRGQVYFPEIIPLENHKIYFTVRQ